MFWISLLSYAALWLYSPTEYAHVNPPLPSPAVCRAADACPCPTHVCQAHASCNSVPTVCPTPAPCDRCIPAPMPVQALHVSPAMPKLYRVEVRFPGQSAKGVPPIRASLLVPEGSKGSLEPIACYQNKTMKCCTLDARVKAAGKGCVLVDLRLMAANNNCEGKEVYERCFQTCQTVPLNKPTGVAFATVGPEPCCGEVIVRESNPMPPPLPYAPGPVTSPVRFLEHPPTYVPPVSVYPLSSSTPAPTCTPAPLPMPVPMPPQAMVPCSISMPAKIVRTSHIRLVHEDGKSRLQCKGEDCSLSVVRLTREAPAIGKLTIAAGKKYIHLTGKEWKACADAVEIRDDGRIVLRGHVRLTSEKAGARAKVQADELCVQLRRGTFDGICSK